MTLDLEKAIKRIAAKDADSLSRHSKALHDAVVGYVAAKVYRGDMLKDHVYTVQLDENNFADWDWDLNPMNHAHASTVIDKMVDLGVEIIEHVPTRLVTFLGLLVPILTKYGHVTFRVPSAS